MFRPPRSFNQRPCDFIRAYSCRTQRVSDPIRTPFWASPQTCRHIAPSRWKDSLNHSVPPAQPLVIRAFAIEMNLQFSVSTNDWRVLLVHKFEPTLPESVITR